MHVSCTDLPVQTIEIIGQARSGFIKKIAENNIGPSTDKYARFSQTDTARGSRDNGHAICKFVIQHEVCPVTQARERRWRLLLRYVLVRP